MIQEKAVRIAKYTSKFITTILLVVSLAIVCPSFSHMIFAASDNTVWHVNSVINKYIFNSDYGSNRSTATLNGIINSQLSTYSLSGITDADEQLTVSYDPFVYSFDLLTQSSSSTARISRGSSLLKDIQPYIVDNLDNKYPLDSVNGGSFTIEDFSNISSLSLYFIGTVNGTITNNGNQFRYVYIVSDISSFDITFSFGSKSRTITDSEGTVWTVPDDVENPVVISLGTSFKQLIDAANLKYVVNDNGYYLLASEEIVSLTLYNPDGSTYDTTTLSYLNQSYTIPFYTTSLMFKSFLYGSLPELKLEKPPVNLPDPDDNFEELVAIKTKFKSDSNPYNDLILYSTEDSEPKNNWFTAWDEEPREFDVWSSKRTLQAVDGKDDFYSTHFDEYVSYPLTVYSSSRAPYDGYCVVSFPKGLLFNGPIDTNIVTGSEYLTSWHIQVEITPYILVQGVRYEISDFACSFAFPVYEEERFSFTIGYEAHIRSNITGTAPVTVQWRCPFEISSHSVSVWYYSDDDEISQIFAEMQKQTEELKKQTEALTEYENADKMDEDADNLKGAINDYDEVSDSLFESAGEGINNFDIASGFDFNGNILTSIGFIGTIISSIIVAMGDFSLLYTIGVCLVIVSVLIGLFKYFGGDNGGDD